MSTAGEKPFSDNPYAPDIPYWLYFAEKTNFAGFLIGAIFYGIVIVLFFQCMGALFSSTYRAKTATKWSFVAFVSIMFSFVTIYTAMDLNLQSISYIDNREFPGNSDLPPGPLGYQFLIHANVLSIVPNFMFILCSWMANGLLIYRCYELYDNNHLVIAFPCFALLASFSTGIWFIHETARPGGTWTLLPSKIGTPYFSITAGLNVILTLLILSRLFLHGRNVRSAMGGQAKISSFFKAALAMIIESSALYAINSLLFVIPRGGGSYVANIFLPILAQTQVIASFLIILRIAEQTALTNDIIISGKPISAVHTKSHEKSMVGGDALPVGGTVGSIDGRGRSVNFAINLSQHEKV